MVSRALPRQRRQGAFPRWLGRVAGQGAALRPLTRGHAGSRVDVGGIARQRDIVVQTILSIEINVSTVCIEDGLRPLLDAQESPANCPSGRRHGRATEPLLESRLRLLPLGRARRGGGWRYCARPPSSPPLCAKLKARLFAKRSQRRCRARPPPLPPPNCAKLTAWSGHAARNTSIALWGGGELEISRVGRTYQGLAGVIRLEQGRSGIS